MNANETEIRDYRLGMDADGELTAVKGRARIDSAPFRMFHGEDAEAAAAFDPVSVEVGVVHSEDR